jgi:hypothetical protein
MNDDDLRQQLRRLSMPAASESSRVRARHQALIAFQQTDSTQPETFEPNGAVWSWRRAVALVVIIGSLPLLFLHHHRAPENLANDREILQQVEKLFPDQVDAVVMKNGKTDLSIAQTAEVGSDQPVVVVFQRGKETIRVLSFSGHRVCLDLGKNHTCFEILQTVAGGVILESENQVWLASQHPVIEGFAMRAQGLEKSL